MNLLINIGAFIILTLLWLGFGAAMLVNLHFLDNGWIAFRRLPIFAQILLAFLFLPVVLGLWVWHMTWPFWLRLALVLGLAWITIYMFFPRLPIA